jgi:hypothetical protein
MTATTLFDAPASRHPWLSYVLQILGLEPQRRHIPRRRAPPPEARPVRQVHPAPEEDLPPWLRHQEAGDWTPTVPPLSEFAPKPEPVAAPAPVPVVNLDSLAEALKENPIAELKRQLRELTYGEFIEAAAGLGFDPKTAWKWATAVPAANVVPMRMAA